MGSEYRENGDLIVEKKENRDLAGPLRKVKSGELLVRSCYKRIFELSLCDISCLVYIMCS